MSERTFPTPGEAARLRHEAAVNSAVTKDLRNRVQQAMLAPKPLNHQAFQVGLADFIAYSASMLVVEQELVAASWTVTLLSAMNEPYWRIEPGPKG